jgi:hypothetical protein
MAKLHDIVSCSMFPANFVWLVYQGQFWWHEWQNLERSQQNKLFDSCIAPFQQRLFPLHSLSSFEPFGWYNEG